MPRPSRRAAAAWPHPSRGPRRARDACGAAPVTCKPLVPLPPPTREGRRPGRTRGSTAWRGSPAAATPGTGPPRQDGPAPRRAPAAPPASTRARRPREPSRPCPSPARSPRQPRRPPPPPSPRAPGRDGPWSRGGRRAPAARRTRSRRSPAPVATPGRTCRSRPPRRRCRAPPGALIGSARPSRRDRGEAAASTFEASTPAFAHTNPCAVSAITTSSRLATIRRASRAIHASRPPSSGTSRPSAFDTIFWVTARTSPARRSGVASESIAARSSPARISGSPSTGRTSTLNGCPGRTWRGPRRGNRCP